MVKGNSMNDWQKRLNSTFGIDVIEPPLFYNFDIGLRFELGDPHGMNQPIRRFLQAHHRASSVAKFLFPDINRVYAFTAGWGPKPGVLETDMSRLKMVFPDIKRENFSFFHDETEENPDPTIPSEIHFSTWYVNKITEFTQIKELLWLDIAYDTPIAPFSDNHKTYFIDFDNETILNAYGDCGMDVVSMGKKILEPVFKEYNEWLFEYNIEKMNQIFK